MAEPEDTARFDGVDWGDLYAESPEKFDTVLRYLSKTEHLLRALVVHGDRNNALQADLGTAVDNLSTALDALAVAGDNWEAVVIPVP